MCSFCKRYSLKQEYRWSDGIKAKYTVAIVEWLIYKRQRAGRSVSYKQNGVGFPLNYCPECGKKLTED